MYWTNQGSQQDIPQLSNCSFIVPNPQSKIKATCHDCMMLHGMECTAILAIEASTRWSGYAKESAIHQIELIQSRHWHSDSSYHSVFSSSKQSLPSVLDKSRVTARYSTTEQLLIHRAKSTKQNQSNMS